ncbi:MAG TPA: multiheme c-type cytochrome [Candidatus Binatia bacterium]|nr:multiheme c-type cytochrome [Candidatus Binatia bacterium]
MARAQASVLLLAGALALLTATFANGQALHHLSIIEPGGFPGWPILSEVQHSSNGVTLTWDGPSGYYQLFQKQHLKDPAWQALGKATNLSRQVTITTLLSNAFFRVAGPSPQYAGASTCIECHQPIHDQEILTPHAAAFSDPAFVARGGQTNASCLPCHTLGYGLPTGFTTIVRTPQLAGVQCENCHGPAANHAANPDDPIAVPRVELAATVCGGCHNSQFVPAQAATLHPPFYEEWNTSPHQAVLPELQTDFAGASGPTVFIPSCGSCHSGTVRESLVEQQPLPNGHEAGAVGIACATCHDPHQNYVHTNVLVGLRTNLLDDVVITNNQLGTFYTNQLRYPLASTNDYFLTTSDAFIENPDVNVCAQCHNHRGATWDTSDRPPHKSPQYNMLLGTFAEVGTGVASNQPASHGLMEKQCVRCHMQTADYVSPQQPAFAGHHFQVESFVTCSECHGSAAGILVTLIQNDISDQIQGLKTELNNWAATKAPASLWAKYGSRAWEYTTPGDLSPGGPGPNAAEQALLPVNIRKARFNLYLVLYDGSYGVHNLNYASALLNTATTWVNTELGN